MKRRDLTEGEVTLWEEAMREVLPVKRRRRVVAQFVDPLSGDRKPAKHQRQKPSASHSVKVPPGLPVMAPTTSSRLDGATARRLREGKVDPEARLDLHGLTQVQAHARLVTFLHRARDRGLRCVLVITGKGSAARSPDASHADWMHDTSLGVLRALVPRWLREGDLQSLVRGHVEAHVRHGGAGAIYVYLRQSRLS
jgi:DNA-nicking Smr family endonuclease